VGRKPQYRKDDATRELRPDEPTQETPKGVTIPVPKRSEVMDAFRKIVRPQKPER